MSVYRNLCESWVNAPQVHVLLGMSPGPPAVGTFKFRRHPMHLFRPRAASPFVLHAGWCLAGSWVVRSALPRLAVCGHSPQEEPCRSAAAVPGPACSPTSPDWTPCSTAWWGGGRWGPGWLIPPVRVGLPPRPGWPGRARQRQEGGLKRGPWDTVLGQLLLHHPLFIKGSSRVLFNADKQTLSQVLECFVQIH